MFLLHGLLVLQNFLRLIFSGFVNFFEMDMFDNKTDFFILANQIRKSVLLSGMSISKKFAKPEDIERRSKTKLLRSTPSSARNLL